MKKFLSIFRPKYKSNRNSFNRGESSNRENNWRRNPRNNSENSESDNSWNNRQRNPRNNSENSESDNSWNNRQRNPRNNRWRNTRNNWEKNEQNDKSDNLRNDQAQDEQTNTENNSLDNRQRNPRSNERRDSGRSTWRRREGGERRGGDRRWGNRDSGRSTWRREGGERRGGDRGNNRGWGNRDSGRRTWNNNYRDRNERDIGSDLSEKHTGIFKLHNTYGFIENTSFYVKYENINGALNKDLVEYVVVKKNDFRRRGEESEYEAKIINVIKRSKIQYVGEVIWNKKNLLVLLDDPRLPEVVTVKSNKDILLNSKVIVELKNFDRENLKGEIVKILGNKNDENIDLVSIFEDFQVQTEFPEEVKREIENCDLAIETYKKQKNREDLTEIPFITIDPENSKDFDDAIAVSKNGENYILNVAIADVWTYLNELKNTDKEAQKRTTSIYFLNSVIHMLPEKLSNDLCSLKPNLERCALAVSLEIKSSGEVLWETLKINPAIIKSHRRFTYDEVNKYFEDKSFLKDENEKIKNNLDLSHELYKKLEEKRLERGYISLRISETKLSLNDKNEILDIFEYKTGEAQCMIENFMVLTNEAVAVFLSKQNLKTIYRIHETPDEEKIKIFLKNAAELNFATEKQNLQNITKKEIIKWFEENKNNHFISLINVMFLRSMKKAKYSCKNLGHYGLSLENYLHFTSPIRRYPDLMVHKILWMHVFEKEKYSELEKTDLENDLDIIADSSSEGEIKASEIEKEIKEYKIIEFMNKKMKNTFEATVVARGKWGVYVQISKYLIEGFVKIKDYLSPGEKLLVQPIYNKKEFKFIKKI